MTHMLSGSDHLAFVLGVLFLVQGYKEYKVLEAKGQALSYAWQSDGGALYFDFHGEPAGDKTGFFQSYAIGTDVAARGAVVTPLLVLMAGTGKMKATAT